MPRKNRPMGPGWAHGPWPGARARPGRGPNLSIFIGPLGGLYLASPENLLLGELIGTSFGAVRSPIRQFWKPNPMPNPSILSNLCVSPPILGIPSNPGSACLAGLGLNAYPLPRFPTSKPRPGKQAKPAMDGS